MKLMLLKFVAALRFKNIDIVIAIVMDRNLKP